MRKSKKIIAAFAGITGVVVLTVGFVSQAAEAKQAFQILAPTPIHMAEAVPLEAWKELNESVKQAKLQYEEQKRIEAEKKAAEEARIAAEQEAARIAAEQEEEATYPRRNRKRRHELRQSRKQRHRRKRRVPLQETEIYRGSRNF